MLAVPKMTVLTFEIARVWKFMLLSRLMVWKVTAFGQFVIVIDG